MSGTKRPIPIPQEQYLLTESNVNIFIDNVLLLKGYRPYWPSG